MKKKKLFISIFPILLSAISLPLFISCSAEGSQEPSVNNINSDNPNNDYPNHNDNSNNHEPNEISNNQTEKDQKIIPDIINQVNKKYFVSSYSNKLFFRWSITKSYSQLSSNNIDEIENTLFPNGNWTSVTNSNTNVTTYEAKNFNDEALFKNFLSIETLKNENNSGEQITLDQSDVNYNGIKNPKNIIGYFEISENKMSSQTQREISLVIELVKGKTWKSNSQNYSIVFTYVQTIFSGS